MDGTKYMIHACPPREWYVYDFLIPSMTAQGIPKENVEVWMDANRDGCLLSCMKCFTECGKRDDGGRWHLQDDVLISRTFKQTTEKYDDGVVCGYVNKNWQQLPVWDGIVPGSYLWNSFPCIRIPDKIAGECAHWFFNDAIYREQFKPHVDTNKCDDTFFFDFFMEDHATDSIRNLNPNIVEHVDYLIGGSVINKDRDGTTRATFWDDEPLVNELIDKLAHR